MGLFAMGFQMSNDSIRPIYKIAAEIRKVWGPKVYFGASPYLSILMGMEKRGDHYGLDSSDDIILRFLSNASTFRGENAKRLKFELAQHLEPSQAKSLLKKYAPKS